MCWNDETIGSMPVAGIYRRRRRRTGTTARALATGWLLGLCCLPALAAGLLMTTKATPRVRRTSPSRPLLRLCAAASTTTTVDIQDTAIDMAYTEYPAHSHASSANGTPPNKSASPVVVLHGLLGNRRNFGTVCTSLSATLRVPRTLYACDLRNHGTSPWTATISYTVMAADVVAFMDRQHIPSCVLVGHSVGGKVAQAVALLYPDRVDGVVVLDIAPVTYNAQDDAHWQVVANVITTLHELPLQPGMSKAQADTILQPHIADPALRAFCLTNADLTAGAWKINMNAIYRNLPQLAAFLPNTDDINYTYNGDVFYIAGGQSKFIKVSYMDAIRRYFPNHMLTTVRGSGHWVHAEAPDDVTALLRRFLDR